MPMRPTGPGGGGPEDVLAVIRRQGGVWLDAVVASVRAVYREAPTVNLNPDAVIAQAAEETDWFTGAPWETRLNFGGRGITPTWDQGLSLPDGETAVPVHLVAYVFGVCPVPPQPYRALDVRGENVSAEGWLGWRGRSPTWRAARRRTTTTRRRSIGMRRRSSARR